MTQTVAATEEPEKKHGVVDLLLMLFIIVFFRPIMWLADKIRMGGVGFGPAFASFVGAAFIILMGLIVLTWAVVIGVGYLLLK